MSLLLSLVGSDLTYGFEDRGTIGRTADNLCVLPDPQKEISKRHAEVQRRGTDYVLMDTSLNGTFVNDALLPIGYGGVHRLSDGDRIRIGHHELVAVLDGAGAVKIPTRWNETILPDVIGAEIIEQLPVDIATDNPVDAASVTHSALRILVAGLMELLNGRAAVKSELRADATQVQITGNNPLKHCVDVDEAMAELFAKPSHKATYLDPLAAFQEAIDDLVAHQVAMMAGNHAALNALLAEVDPQRMQDRFDEQAGRNVGARQSRYWKLWVDHYERECQDGMAHAFHDALSRAYTDAESETQKLRVQRRASHGNN